MADDGEKELRALCKLFIGGLPRSVTDDELAEAFLQFCDDECLNDCVVIKDENKQSRGFGFVTYNKLCDTDNCLANRPHMLQGKEVEVKNAIPREDQNTTNHSRTSKIFVGGFPKDATEDDMTQAIENYTLAVGESLNAKVNKVDIIKSKEGGRSEEVSRGFCFVEMATEDDADKVVIVKNFTVKGKRVEVKKAEPKGAKGGGGGGRGGSRGGGSRSGMGGFSQFGGGGGGRDEYFGGFAGSDYGGFGGYGGMGGGASYFGQMMNDSYGFPTYNQSSSSFGPSRTSNGRYGGGGGGGGGRGRGGRGGGYRPY